jgi:hypothetical protein
MLISGVLLALAVCIPGLFSGYFLDDYFHIATIEGAKTPGAPFALFRFSDGSTETVREYKESGPFPWFMLPDIKLHFFRPLSSATHVLDHAVFPESAFLQHLQSGLWYALLVLAAGLVYRRSLPPQLALFAIVIFAVDEAHWIPSIWLAARNALAATAPALLGVVAHLRWRENGWRWGLPLSVLGYALGMLGGETAIAIMAYVLAYEMIGARDNVVSRLRGILPAAAMVVVFLAVYKWQDFGVRGSGIYLDPLGETVQFLLAAPGRYLTLLGTQFFTAPAELSTLTSRAHYPLVIIGLAAVIIIARATRSIWPVLDPDTRRALKWLSLGAAGAMLPGLATFPSGRLLLAPSIGFAPVIAVLIHHWWKHRDVGVKLRRLGPALAVVHLVVAPVMWCVVPWGPAVLDARVRAVAENVPIDDAVAADTRYVILNSPEPMSGLYTPIVRLVEGHPQPGGWWALTLSMKDLVVTRTAENAFELAAAEGALIGHPMETLFRSPRDPFTIGDTVAFAEVEIEVLSVEGPWPRRIRCTFDRPLEDPRFQFLSWGEDGYEIFEWGPVGETRELPYRFGPFRLAARETH